MISGSTLMFIVCCMMMLQLPAYAQLDTTRTRQSQGLNQKLPQASYSNGKFTTNPGTMPGQEKAIATNQLRSAEKLKPKTLYSNRRLKSMYDSMGLKKMDTLLAIAPKVKRMSSGDMISTLNSAFVPGGSSRAGILKSQSTLSESKLKDDALSELAPIRGTKFKSQYRRKADSLLRIHLKKADSIAQARTKKMDSVRNLYGGNQRKIDSLSDVINGRQMRIPDRKADSLLRHNALKNKFDSAQRKLGGIASKNSLQTLKGEANMKSGAKEISSAERKAAAYAAKRMKATRKAKRTADSLNRELALDKGAVKSGKQDEANGVSTIIIGQKNKLAKRFYFEAIASPVTTAQSTGFRFSPALGFPITRHLSLAAGPNMLFVKENAKWTMTTGLRSFAKYQVVHQRGYVQLENWLGGGQATGRTSTFLAGGGALIPTSSSTAINVSLLYRITKTFDVPGAPGTSPWVFRVGFSAYHNPKK